MCAVSAEIKIEKKRKKLKRGDNERMKDYRLKVVHMDFRSPIFPEKYVAFFFFFFFFFFFSVAYANFEA